MDMREQRVDERLPLEHDVRIMFTRGQNADGPRELTVTGRIMNQSRGGFCLVTPFHIIKGDLLKACTDISKDSEFYFDVRWVYKLETGYMFGCNFADLSETMSVN